jgi:hypothetical protein
VPNPLQVIRGAIVVAVLIAAFIGLARTGAVHGEMCLSQVGCVRAGGNKAAIVSKPSPAVKQLRKHELPTPLGPAG